VSLQFLRDLRALCDEKDLLLIFDEVQCGMGRTGKLFAHEWAGIAPDIMAVAKAIGGGFPMGACLATEEAARGMVAGVHGTTYGGNPLAMAVGNAVLDVILEEGLASLKDRYPDLIADVRGSGLMLGIKCAKSNADLVAAMRSEHLLAVPAGDNVVRLLPPLIVTTEEAREALARTEAALEMLSRNGAAN
jgi:acetylornithine/N-succinyldiaminopimelate aminotransferase